MAALFDSRRWLAYQLKKGAGAASIDGGQAEEITGAVGAADLPELPHRNALDPLNPRRAGSDHNRAFVCVSKLSTRRGKEILGRHILCPAGQALRTSRAVRSLIRRTQGFGTAGRSYRLSATSRNASTSGISSLPCMPCRIA